MKQELIKKVAAVMPSDNGHGIDHILRVRDLALKFAEQEGADLEIVELAAMLHDVDDYKLFGQKQAKKLINARQIMSELEIEPQKVDQVLEIISTMGYSKYLAGIRPQTLEGKIVSDADMCDAIGSTGIIRIHEFGLSKDKPFFDKNTSPKTAETDSKNYRKMTNQHSVQHFFDKILKINNILMTESGRQEGQKRHQIVVDFLRHLFEEEDAKEWLEYLEHFIVNSSIQQ